MQSFDALRRKLNTGVRRISLENGTSKSSLWRVQHNLQLYPYNIQRVQCLTDMDLPRRINLWQWFVQDIALPMFLSNIVFTDVAGFSREGFLISIITTPALIKNLMRYHKERIKCTFLPILG